MKWIILKALGVSFFSVVVATLSSVVMMIVTYDEILMLGIFMPMVMAMLLTFPIAFIVFVEKQKFLRAVEELERSNTLLKKMHEDARNKAELDLMTGILNRNSFLSRLEQNKRKSDRGALLVMDIDKFKLINDTYGHQAGDQALISMVKFLKETKREQDYLGRLGGEEFGAFLSDVTPDQAVMIAERIRSGIERMQLSFDGDACHQMTISIGVVMNEGNEGVKELMRIADERMYMAKNAGRNRVVAIGRKGVSNPTNDMTQTAA